MKRSKFSLSHYRLLTCQMGELIPIGLLDVLPGDTIQHATSMLVRVAPLVRPIMHPVVVKIHHWFVPYRLLWDKWQDFITGGPDGLDASVFPVLPSTGTYAIGSLADYLGVPQTVHSSVTVSALPFRAYALIWNEWYRDQDIQTKLAMSVGSGVDSTTSQVLQNVTWEKDYFTTSRPWTQKGAEVTLPLGTSAPVTRVASAAAWKAFDAGTQTPAAGGAMSIDSGTSNLERVAGTDISLDPGSGGLIANLSTATAATINQLRNSFAIQRYEEARARYGSRYTEYLRYLGVRSSDARLQRPEYLGGGKQTLQFSEVLASANTGLGEVTGELRGHGITALRSNRYRRFFEEHGVILSLMSVLPRTMYLQGLSKAWSKRTKESYWQKELEHIGQAEVKLRELYAQSSAHDAVFGYQDRYDEYRRQESSVSGEFKTIANDWHMARDFASQPALNAAFIASNPTTRVFAFTTVDQLYVMANHSIQARRLVSQTGTSSSF